MAINNPTSSIPFQNGTAVAVSQPLFISGDGFFAYAPGYSADWIQYDITPSVKLNAVDYNDKDTALFAGNNGVIVTFNKNDLTIKTNVLDPNINFNNVSFYSSSNRAVAIGDSGSVYKTTDAGTSWSKLTLPTNVTASLKGITFTTSSVWYICGDKGTILSSSNEGSSWYEYNQFLFAFPFFGSYDSSSIPNDYRTYNFNDIKFQSYENNGIPTSSYDIMYVVGNSGSVFANLPNRTITGPPRISPPQWYDMSLFRMTQAGNFSGAPQDSSHTSSVYVRITHMNEWYNEGTPSEERRPTNFGVIGSNGEIYIYNCVQTLEPPELAEDTSTEEYIAGYYAYPYSSSISFPAGSPISVTGGGIYSLISSNVGGLQNNIFYQRAFLVTTNDGRLIQFDYPAENDFDNIGQTTSISGSTFDAFSGAVTDVDLPTGDAIYNNAFVRFGLDKPFPAKSNFMMHGASPINSLNNYLTQGMRLYRPFPSENFVTFTDSFPDGTGLIIPENYNKDLNYIEIAKKAGLISG
jgi:hypothetical protein